MEIVEELHAPFLMTQLILILSVGGGGYSNLFIGSDQALCNAR